MPGLDDLPFNKSAPPEKVKEKTKEGYNAQLDQSGDRVGESAGRAGESGGFGQAAQFIQAMQREEGKQRGQEDKIVQILKNYLNTNKYPAILEQVIKLLSLNVYAGFLLATLTLLDEELKLAVLEAQQANGKLSAGQTARLEHRLAENQLPEKMEASQSALPEAAKQELQNWIFSLTEIASAYPQKFIDELSSKNQNADYEFQLLLRLILNEFFTQHQTPAEVTQLTQFAEFILQHILAKIVAQIENQQHLK